MEIHDELKDMNEITCPFCNRQLKDYMSVEKDESCCENMKLENINGEYVCVNCGLVDRYMLVNEYIDFWENKSMFRRKSVYQWKYHVENILNSMYEKYDVYVSYNNRCKIYSIFELIGKNLSQVNNARKRMINLNYVFRKVFKILGLPYKHIPLLKSKKTLMFYNKWWDDMYSLIADDVYRVICR